MKSEKELRVALEQDIMNLVGDYTLSPQGFLNVATDLVPKVLRDLADLYDKEVANMEREINEHKN